MTIGQLQSNRIESVEAVREPELLIDLQKGVLWLTLNRPQRRNALSLTLYEALGLAIESASHDDNVRAIVLSGAGGSFCAGGDVKRMSEAPLEELSIEQKIGRLRQRTRVVELLHTMPKPSLAMLSGAAVGAGMSLALACDLRVGDPTVSMRTGFLDVGLSGDFGGHYFLPRIVGPSKARELYLLSQPLDAPECLRLGLLNSLVGVDELRAAAEAISSRWVSASRVALGHMKANLTGATERTLSEVLDGEAWRHVRCTSSSEHLAAVNAFIKRR